jgi:hypothetical protein
VCEEGMRLDGLLASSLDVSTVIAKHLDVHALVRLGLVSKDLLRCIKQDGILYASFLKTFPTIRNLPSGMPSSFYLQSLRVYYGPFSSSMTDHELTAIICMSIRETGGIVSISHRVNKACRAFGMNVCHSSQRKRILECVRDWENIIVTNCSIYFEDCDDACEILEKITKVIEFNFNFSEPFVSGSEGGFLMIY